MKLGDILSGMMNKDVFSDGECCYRYLLRGLEFSKDRGKTWRVCKTSLEELMKKNFKPVDKTK